MYDLNVDLIVSWTMYGAIEPKSNHKYSAVHRKPDPVAGSAVAPTALHLTEARDAALFSPEATARSVDKLYVRFWIDGKM